VSSPDQNRPPRFEGTPPDAWPAARAAARRLISPVERFLAIEAASGILLLAAAVVALAWANSPWQGLYQALWHTPLGLRVGHWTFERDLHFLINDGLMVIFFFVVGLEIRRELHDGELSEPRRAALPAFAALGGMIVPAVIYLVFNGGTPAAKGWGVPMATDIAFAVGVVTLLGRRVPLAAKIFLLTLAVADDIGAIVVIAVFYTGSLSWGWLAAAVAGLAVIFTMRRSDVQSLAPYLAVGAFIWLALLESGVHATLAGVALGLLTPAWPLRSPRRFPAEARRLLDRIDKAYYDRVLTQDEFAENELLTAEVARMAMYSTSPLERLESRLSPWVSYVIVPVFALANAGVRFSGEAVSGLFSDPVVLGVGLGLVVGKTVGVFSAATIAVKLGWGRLPAGATWRHVFGLSMVAGVGFTVALFVTSISFTDPALADSAKIGILLGSAIAGVAGYLFLRAIPAPDAEPGAQEAASKWTIRLANGQPATNGRRAPASAAVSRSAP
jgi:NhaA family Na+:H+ antiporter